MKHKESTAIAIALILIVAGVALCSLAFSDGTGDKGEISISTEEMVTNTHAIEEKFSNISIDTAVADVSFELAKDGECKVVCRENKEAVHTVAVKNGTLIIEKTDEREWYEHISIGINTESEKVTVYLPGKSYDILDISDDTGSVEVSEIFTFKNAEIITATGAISFSAAVKNDLVTGSDTGYITVSGANPETLDVSTATGGINLTALRVLTDITVKTDTGYVQLRDVKCRNLEMKSATGAISLEKVIASGDADINTDTGDVELRGFDAEAIYIRTATGEVSGTLLSEKIFITESDTGDIDVPKSITGGRCEISTDTGDIEIEIA